MKYEVWNKLPLKVRDEMRYLVETCRQSCRCSHVWDARCASEYYVQCVEGKEDVDETSQDGEKVVSSSFLPPCKYDS